jgi:L-rhamnose mutarotase
MNKMKLTHEQRTEIKDYQNAKWKDVVALAKKFNVSLSSIRYLLNYKNYRERHNAVMAKWRKNNPEKWAVINRKAVKKYSSKKKEVKQ